MQTKSSPALPRHTSPEKKEDFREVRSRLAPGSSPSKQREPEEKDKTEKSFREARKRLSHYSPPPKEVPKGHSQAEERLRKMQSESLLPVREESKETERAQEDVPKQAGKVKDKEKEAPISAASLKDQGKGKEAAPHPIELHHPVSETGHAHECDWKEKYITLQSEVGAQGGQTDDIGLEGLTIVLHMKGRDDLVINTDLRNLEQ